MNVNLSSKDPQEVQTPLLVMLYSKEQAAQLKKQQPTEGLLGDIALLLADFTGDKGETAFHYTRGHAQRLCLVGLGEEKQITAHTIRKALTGMPALAKKRKVTTFTVNLHHTFSVSAEDTVRAATEALVLGHYSWDKYKTKKEDKPVKTATILVQDDNKKMQTLVKETQVLCEQNCFVRDCINENADTMTPLMLEKLSRETAKTHKLALTVLDKKDMQKLKMNLILGVAQGSNYPPRMIFLHYKGNKKSKKTTALVGKGITFDTGGLNLKPTKYIENMKCDMSGAATVLGVIRAAAALNLPINLVAVLSCAENAISAGAQKPGDVVKAYNGVTVEITNTDAEGRLVMADALSYVQEKYKPTTVIDVATLTGSVMATFGYVAAGVMGTDQKLIDSIVAAGETTHELIWQLPLYEEFEEHLKSNIADTTSCVISPYAGAITAGFFLKKFITVDSWAHLDIAGTAYLDKAGSSQGLFGASGYGVRLLIEALRNYD